MKNPLKYFEQPPDEGELVSTDLEKMQTYLKIKGSLIEQSAPDENLLSPDVKLWSPDVKLWSPDPNIPDEIDEFISVCLRTNIRNITYS